jgi:hypothetical protein
MLPAYCGMQKNAASLYTVKRRLVIPCPVFAMLEMKLCSVVKAHIDDEERSPRVSSMRRNLPMHLGIIVGVKGN